MSIELRPYQPDEARRYLEVCEMAFGEGVNEAGLASWLPLLERERSLCAIDDGAMVATAGIYSFSMTIPGGELPVAAVTMVGVLPSHRRRGILTSMMRRQLEDVRGRGEPIAILWASEGGIYQRFGYGLASLIGRIQVDRARTTYRRPTPPQGRMRLIETDEAAALLPAIYDRFRRDVPGAVSRSEAWWRAGPLYDAEHVRRGAGPLFRAVYDVDGSPEGYALYRIRSGWDFAGSLSTLLVREAIGVTPSAVADVWRFLFDVDLVAQIEADRAEPDHPLLLLVEEPRRLRLTLGDGLWLRIVDVPGALTPRSYAARDALTLELEDGFCPWNAGRWRVDAREADGVRVERTSGAPDLVLDVTDLAAAYLGAFSFSDLRHAGRVTECRPGAVARADRMFRTERAPWNPVMF
ncbi:MAG: GNAT family N-acetyltransferase [Chloroflexota bacterium]|nr:GNAT family N-acetyltransferase [Chloroflexota bacterium]